MPGPTQPKQEFPVPAGALAGLADPVAEANDQAASHAGVNVLGTGASCSTGPKAWYPGTLGGSSHRRP